MAKIKWQEKNCFNLLPEVRDEIRAIHQCLYHMDDSNLIIPSYYTYIPLTQWSKSIVCTQSTHGTGKVYLISMLIRHTFHVVGNDWLVMGDMDATEIEGIY